MAAILAEENQERASRDREQDILLFPSKSFSLVHQINLTADHVIKNTHKGLSKIFTVNGLNPGVIS